MEATLAYPGSASKSDVKPSVWLRLFPSFTDIAFLLPIWFLFAVLQGSRTLLFDGDTGWHIRTGDWILQHRQVPHTDIFSFTKYGQPWFAWEWGWDVLASLVHSKWGLPGIVLANTVLIGLISALLFRLVRRHTGNHVLALAVSCTAMIGSSIHWLARPHLLSWLFVLVFIDTIDRFETERHNRLWCLPVLTLLWVNLHGSFFIGITFLFTYAIVGALREIITIGESPSFNCFAKSKAYLLCGTLCLGASFVNPYGWHLHQHLIAYLRDSAQLNNISEFGSLDFHSTLARFYEPFFFLGPCVALWSVQRRKWAEAVLLILWAHLSLCVVRNVPIFLLLAAAPTAGFLEALLDRLAKSGLAGWVLRAASFAKHFGHEFSNFEEAPRTYLACAAGVVVVAILVRIPAHGSGSVEDFDSRDFPVKAASVIAGHMNARVFTHDQWGDYLIYRFYPRLHVFVDGRSDFYGAQFSKGWSDAQDARYNWREELTRFSIDTVLLQAKDPLASVLKQTRSWTPIFDDGFAIVFRANSTTVSSGLRSGGKHL